MTSWLRLTVVASQLDFGDFVVDFASHLDVISFDRNVEWDHLLHRPFLDVPSLVHVLQNVVDLVSLAVKVQVGALDTVSQLFEVFRDVLPEFVDMILLADGLVLLGCLIPHLAVLLLSTTSTINRQIVLYTSSVGQNLGHSSWWGSNLQR